MEPSARDRQRRDALAVANQKRKLKSELKRKLKNRELDPVALLRRPNIEWEQAVEVTSIEDYLKAIWRFGETTAREIVMEFGAPGMTRIALLTVDDRKELAKLIDDVRTA